MEQTGWILWLVLSAIFIVAEVFTLGFVLFWFGVGALAAAVLSYLGLGPFWQFAAFALVSMSLTAMSRTIFAKYLPHVGERMKTGVDSLPGQIGTVASSSKGALNQASVKVFGSTWTAFPINEDTKLDAGEKVEIVEVRGSSLYVRPSKGSSRDWRGED